MSEEVSKEIKLQFPIQYKNDNNENVVIDTLTLGRFKLKHLKVLPKELVTSGGKSKSVDPVVLIPLVSQLAKIPEEAAEEIDIADLEKVVEIFEDFLSSSLGQGGKEQSGE